MILSQDFILEIVPNVLFSIFPLLTANFALSRYIVVIN